MTDEERIEEIRGRLRVATPPGSLVLLFGARARGCDDLDEDFHVLVVEPNVDRPIAEAVRLRSALDDLDAPIELTVMEEQRFRCIAAVRGTTAGYALRRGELLAST